MFLKIQMLPVIADVESLLVNFEMKENFFEILEFDKASLLINEEDLEMKYILKQSENFDNSDLQARINFAYENLKNPLKRMEHFFLIKGFKANNKANQEFLMNFFELNEEIENLENEEEKRKFHKKFLNDLREILKKMNFLFEKENLDAKKMSELYVEAKYINRILENHFNFK